MIDIISDIHLEFRPKISSLQDLIKFHPYLKKNYDIESKHNSTLLLAGDIGYPTDSNYWKFLESCSQIYRDVVFCTGNHEYYIVNQKSVLTINETDELIRNKTNQLNIKNLHFLQKDSIMLDNFRILGCTLFTNINPEQNVTYYKSYNDSNSIFVTKTENATVNDLTNIHIDHVTWLKTQIDDDQTPTIVMTHHLPTRKLIHPKYEMYSYMDSMFYTNLEHLFKNNVKLWVAGHTHSHVCTYFDQTFVITNPFGYAKECKNTAIRKLEYIDDKFILCD